MSWFFLALGSSVFAALTSILAKIGIEGVNSTLATAIRTAVVLIMSWGMVFITNTQNGILEISKRSWLFLILSGIATGASWLCYYKALQMGQASKVVPIDKLSVVITMVLAAVVLQEQFTPKSIVGCVLIAAGTVTFKLGFSECHFFCLITHSLCRKSLCGTLGEITLAVALQAVTASGHNQYHNQRKHQSENSLHRCSPSPVSILAQIL